MSDSRSESAFPEVLDLRVREMRWEAQDVLSLVLDDPEGRELPPWEPGAHIDVRFSNGIERQYSLCSDPRDRSGWRIAILAERPSRGGSRFVHSALRVGDAVSASLPMNNFSLDEAEEYVFVAGGIGVTPIIPMVEAATRQQIPWKLAYLGSQADRMAFRSSPLMATDRCTIVAADSDPRLNLKDWVGVPERGVHVYACGPERMLDELELLSADWPRGALHIERFQAKALGESIGADSFDVEAKKSGMVVTVDKTCTVLEMLEQAGIGIPSSCREGVCGTCETGVIDGAVEHRDSILTPDEREDNETMMVCVSRSLGDKLVLDI